MYPEQSIYRKRRQSSISDFSESLTEQHHKQTCDIHTIIRNSIRTGVQAHVNTRQPQYMEMPNGIDFMAMQLKIAEATELFESVPSGIRSRFQNNPALFLDWIQSADNRDEMEKLGFDTGHLPPVAAPEAPKTEPAVG